VRVELYHAVRIDSVRHLLSFSRAVLAKDRAIGPLVRQLRVCSFSGPAPPQLLATVIAKVVKAIPNLSILDVTHYELALALKRFLPAALAHLSLRGLRYFLIGDQAETFNKPTVKRLEWLHLSLSSSDLITSRRMCTITLAHLTEFAWTVKSAMGHSQLGLVSGLHMPRLARLAIIHHSGSDALDLLRGHVLENIKRMMAGALHLDVFLLDTDMPQHFTDLLPLVSATAVHVAYSRILYHQFNTRMLAMLDPEHVKEFCLFVDYAPVDGLLIWGRIYEILKVPGLRTQIKVSATMLGPRPVRPHQLCIRDEQDIRTLWKMHQLFADGTLFCEQEICFTPWAFATNLHH
jgi:hypothetical protein